MIRKGTACNFLTIFLRESYRVLHRSRDLCGDRIARPSSCGSRYVDYIVLAGGSSVRRCTKAWTMLAHTRAHIHVSTRFHPLDQAILSLSLSRLAYPLHSYFPIHRFANVIVSLSLSSSAEPLSLPPITRTIYQRSARFTLGISCPLYRRSFPYIRPPSPFPLGFPKHLFATEIKHQGAALDRSCKTIDETFRNFVVFRFPTSKPMPAREQIFKATALVSSDKVLATPFSFFRRETKPLA